MRAFNDIEREFERFEAEIEQIPAAAGQPRPQQPQAKSSAFIPPQLRARLGLGQPGTRLPAPPPPPPPGAMGSSYGVRPAYQPAMTFPVNFGPGLGKAAPIRPKVVIEAKPIRYDEAASSSGVNVSEPSKPPAPSDALARAKAVLESLKMKSEVTSSPSVTDESVQMALAKSGPEATSASSAIPLPLNMPGMSASVPNSALMKKGTTSKQVPSTTAASSNESEYFNGVRKAGGEIWTDATLFEWDANDHRMFCGDLGNETTDESLAKVFSIYPSFQKAKVLRDKRTNKTRGFGFVSFKDAQDLARAIREMNGKYVGNRPIKLRKSTWKDRNVDVVKKKEKAKKKLGLYY